MHSAVPCAVLTNTFYDPNIPTSSTDNASKHPQSIETTAQKAIYKQNFPNPKQTKKGTKSTLEKSIYAPALQTNHALKRRPSAPSTLRYPNPLRQSSILGPGRANTTSNEHKENKQEAQVGATNVDSAANGPSNIAPKPAHKSGLHSFLSRLRHPDSKISGSEVVEPQKPPVASSSAVPHQSPAPGPFMRPSASMHDLHAYHSHDIDNAPHSTMTYNAQARLGSDDDDGRTAWMHTRSGVDFNRPPSQVSLLQAGGRDLGLGLGYAQQEWGDSLFTSSSSGESSCDEEGEQARERESSENENPRDTGKATGNNNARRRHSGSHSTKSDGERASGLVHRRVSYGGLSLRGHGRETITLPDPVHDLGVRELGAPRFSLGLGFKLGDALELDFDSDDIHMDDVPFGLDVDDTSTPAGGWRHLKGGKEGGEEHVHIRKTSSLPVLRLGEDEGEEETLSVERGKTLPKSVSAEELRKQSVRHERGGENWAEEDGEENMELTGSTAGGKTATLTQQRSPHEYDDDLEDTDEAETRSTIFWSSDSLISPPTAYLQQKEKRVELLGQCDKNTDEEDALDFDKADRGLASTSVRRSSFEFTLGPPFEDACQAISPNKIHAVGRVDARAKSIHLAPDNSASTTTKRTRSGTIVPAHPPVPPGARRTRSGTIVGPLPPAPPPAFGLPAIPGAGAHLDAVGADGSACGRVGAAPTRTRSGTIVAGGFVARPAGLNAGVGGSTRRGSVLGMRPEQNVSAADGLGELGVEYTAEVMGEEEEDHIVECYADSLYLPSVESSPDPLDLLRFAGIAEAGDEDEEWRIVREPLSPEAPKRKRRKVGLGLATRAANAGRWLKAKSKLTVRFVGAGDGEEGEGAHGEPEAGEMGDVESSDDELLLVDDSAARLLR